MMPRRLRKISLDGACNPAGVRKDASPAGATWWLAKRRLCFYNFVIHMAALSLTYGWVFGKDIAVTHLGWLVPMAMALFIAFRGIADLCGMWVCSLFAGSTHRDNHVLRSGIPIDRRTAITYPVVLRRPEQVACVAGRMRQSLLLNDESNILAILLSDSSDALTRKAEERAVERLQQEFGPHRVYYFHRRKSVGRKWGAYQALAAFLHNGGNRPPVFTSPKWDLRAPLRGGRGKILGVDLGQGFYIDTVSHPEFGEGRLMDPSSRPVRVGDSPVREREVLFARTFFVRRNGGKLVLHDDCGNAVSIGRGLFGRRTVRGDFRVDQANGTVEVELPRKRITRLRYDLVAVERPTGDGYSLYKHPELNLRTRGPGEFVAHLRESDITGDGRFVVHSPTRELLRYGGTYLRIRYSGTNWRVDSQEQVFDTILGDVASLKTEDPAARVKYLAIADADNIYGQGVVRQAVAVLAAHPDVVIVQPFVEQANVYDSAYVRWLAHLPQQLMRALGRGDQALMGQYQFLGKGVVDIAAYMDLVARPGEEKMGPWVRCHDFIESLYGKVAYVHDITIKEDAPVSWYVENARQRGWRTGDWMGIIEEYLPHSVVGRLYNVLRGRADPGHIGTWPAKRIMDKITLANVVPIVFVAFLLGSWVGAVVPGVAKPGDLLLEWAVMMASLGAILAVPNVLGNLSHKVQQRQYGGHPVSVMACVAGDLGKGLWNAFISTMVLMQSLYDHIRHVILAIREAVPREAVYWKPMADIDADPSSLSEAYRTRSVPVALALTLTAAAIVVSEVWNTSGVLFVLWASPILASFLLGPALAYFTARSATDIKEAMFLVEAADRRYMAVGDAIWTACGNDVERKFRFVKDAIRPGASSCRAAKRHDRLSEVAQDRLARQHIVAPHQASEIVRLYLENIEAQCERANREVQRREEAISRQLAEKRARIRYVVALDAAVYRLGVNEHDGERRSPRHTGQDLTQILYRRHRLSGLEVEGEPVTKRRFADDVEARFAQLQGHSGEPLTPKDVNDPHV